MSNVDARAELPYLAEYSKSNRAACKGCSNKIEKDVLRMAKMVKNPRFDGVTPHWFHYECFFKKIKPKSTGDIGHFSELRYEDQKRIQGSIEAGSHMSSVSDFMIEYAKSKRSLCTLCEININKDEIRMGKLDTESDLAATIGRSIPRWFHVDCFQKSREENGFNADVSEIKGFEYLEPEDQATVRKKVPKPTDPKKRKKDSSKNEDTKEKNAKKAKKEKTLDERLKKQSDKIYKYIGALKAIKKSAIAELIEANNLKPHRDLGKNIEMLADCISFGVPKACPKCGEKPRFRVNTYICGGQIDEWTSCDYETTRPERSALVIPDDLVEQYDILKSYKFSPRDRVIPKVDSQIETVGLNQLFADGGEGSSGDGSVKTPEGKPLAGHSVAIIGKLSSAAKVKSKLKSFGANISMMDRTTLFAVTTLDEFEKAGPKIDQAKELNCLLVSESFMEELRADTPNLEVPVILLRHRISQEWGGEIAKKYENLLNKSKVKSFKSKLKSKSTSNGKAKFVVKGGDVVDPKSGMENEAHVYSEGKDVFSVVLNKVDLRKDKNSYYKIQVLKSDIADVYWLFYSWGRIGTDIGDYSMKEFRSAAKATETFRSKFFELTDNEWDDRANFTRRPGKYYIVSTTHGQIRDFSAAKSSLALEIQELIKFIFDLNMMKDALLSLEVDLSKMPLGKISSEQIAGAFSVLRDIMKLLLKDSKPADDKKKAALVNKCEQFYTLVPHSFGTEKLKLIKSKEEVEEKLSMLETLRDTELAFEIMESVSKESTDDPIMAHYQKLGVQLDVIKDGPEYDVVYKYLTNTHAPTHPIKLHIQHLYRVERSEEESRYKPFAKEKNRMLLWHGSRCSNYAGILSQGLRIAPPEAPSTGYMFGKGIYFADMSTKSAAYCYSHLSDNCGLLLLSEVALGEMWDLKEAQMVESLPDGKGSVRGLGRTAPDSSANTTLSDGVIVPLGKGKPTGIKDTSLLYNEYIVYDQARVRLRYLVKVKIDSVL